MLVSRTAGSRLLCGIRGQNNQFHHSPPSAVHNLICQWTELCYKLRKSEAKSHEKLRLSAFFLYVFLCSACTSEGTSLHLSQSG